MKLLKEKDGEMYLTNSAIKYFWLKKDIQARDVSCVKILKQNPRPWKNKIVLTNGLIKCN